MGEGLGGRENWIHAPWSLFEHELSHPHCVHLSLSTGINPLTALWFCCSFFLSLPLCLHIYFFSFPLFSITRQAFAATEIKWNLWCEKTLKVKSKAECTAQQCWRRSFCSPRQCTPHFNSCPVLQSQLHLHPHTGLVSGLSPTRLCHDLAWSPFSFVRVLGFEKMRSAPSSPWSESSCLSHLWLLLCLCVFRMASSHKLR